MKKLENKNDEYVCPKCGGKIELNKTKLNEIILSNDKIKETIIGIKDKLENIIIRELLNR